MEEKGIGIKRKEGLLTSWEKGKINRGLKGEAGMDGDDKRAILGDGFVEVSEDNNNNTVSVSGVIVIDS